MHILEVNKKRENIGVQTYTLPNIHINTSYMKTTSNLANIPHWQNTSLKNLPEEVWKDIPSYKGYYKVSSMGRVKSISRFVNSKNNSKKLVKEIILKQWISVSGYPLARLAKLGVNKSFTVHSLLAKSFMDKKEFHQCVNHKNSIRFDNNIENLEWTTFSGNIIHMYNNPSFVHPSNKEVSMYTKRGVYVKSFDSIVSAAKYIGHSSSSNITSCCKGNRKTVGGFVWKYSNIIDNAINVGK